MEELNAFYLLIFLLLLVWSLSKQGEIIVLMRDCIKCSVLTLQCFTDDMSCKCNVLFNSANTIILSPWGSSECKMRHLSSKSLVGNNPCEIFWMTIITYLMERDDILMISNKSFALQLQTRPNNVSNLVSPVVS